MTKQANLITFLFDGQSHLLSPTLMQWMEISPRYTIFIDSYRDKIRKKIRLARDYENMLDLRDELEVAYCLLNDRRFSVSYEPYASAKRRGPDFAVIYRVNLAFNIEVARIREEEASPEETKIARKEERILRILSDKLGQMQPGMANILVIHSTSTFVQSIDLDRLMQELKARVEKRDPTFYLNSRYSSPAAFYKDFLHLNGILLWTGDSQLWVNKQARPKLEEKVMSLVKSMISGVSET